jgi:hypothetical protein
MNKPRNKPGNKTIAEQLQGFVSQPKTTPKPPPKTTPKPPPKPTSTVQQAPVQTGPNSAAQSVSNRRNDPSYGKSSGNNQNNNTGNRKKEEQRKKDEQRRKEVQHQIDMEKRKANQRKAELKHMDDMLKRTQQLQSNHASNQTSTHTPVSTPTRPKSVLPTAVPSTFMGRHKNKVVLGTIGVIGAAYAVPRIVTGLRRKPE